MSNLINNILTNESNISSNSGTLTTEQAVKDKPSLFDSLLSTNIPIEDTKVNNDIKQPIKEIKPEEIAILAEKVDENTTTPSEGIDNNEQKATTGLSSLLDRLIIEAKNTVSSTSEEATKDKNFQLSNNVIMEESKVNSVDNSKEKELNIKQLKNPENEVQLTDSNTLSDKLVEVKNDVKEIKNINDKEANNTSIIKEEIAVNNNVEEVVNKESNKLSNKAIDSSLQIKEELKANNNIEEVVNKEANKLSDKESESILPKEVINTIINSDIKTDENKEIKVDNSKEIEVNKKEEKINALDLLDKTKIITEAKIEVNISTTDNVVKKENDIKLNDKQEEITVNSSMNNSLVGMNDILVDSAVKTSSTDTTITPIKEETKNINLKIDNVASLTNEDIENSTTINGLEKNDIKKDAKLSLMDQLIQKNSEKSSLDTVNSITEDINTPLKSGITKDLISNIYLSSQKNKISNQSLFNKNEAISLLKDGNSIQSVKTSAEMLDLGLESVNIEQDIGLDNIDLKKSNIDLLNKKNLIDNLLLKNDIRGEEVKDLITKSVEASKALIDNTLTVADDAVVNVNSPLSYNIQSRIIGAKQQMSAMMSDIAKQMYENYKPPVTAFKINLNPLDLGSIAILMKSDKNNGLTISMNVSNNVTLETLIENQNVLKNSLNKTFDESTKFNLDFGSSNQNNSNQSSNNEQRSNRQFEQQMDTKSILELQEENKDREEKVIDYM